jgi:hypothetical protein
MVRAVGDGDKDAVPVHADHSAGPGSARQGVGREAFRDGPGVAEAGRTRWKAGGRPGTGGVRLWGKQLCRKTCRR